MAFTGVPRKVKVPKRCGCGPRTLLMVTKWLPMTVTLTTFVRSGHLINSENSDGKISYLQHPDLIEFFERCSIHHAAIAMHSAKCHRYLFHWRDRRCAHLDMFPRDLNSSSRMGTRRRRGHLDGSRYHHNNTRINAL